MTDKEVKKAMQIQPKELERQQEYSAMVRTVLQSRYDPDAPMALVQTYGCQGNVADSERISGMLKEMGYELTDVLEEADLVLYNTCAIREHAQDRVFGNLGALKHHKTAKPNAIFAVCGCMVQQEHAAQKIEKSFSFVNLVFGTHVIHRLPEFLYRVLCSGRRVFELTESDGAIAEGLPVYRDGTVKAWLPIMYGCNNFCSYCVVPYVRGRERSREKKAIIEEFQGLVNAGYKEITLLGQNVNSYGKGLEDSVNFASLLRELNDIEGNFIIRFMTSHPKDCTYELLDVMAQGKKIAKHLHLPFQSGNNRILKEMNRRYTREQYLDFIHYARKAMPNLSITSDVIVGFPGETYEEFCDTLSLIKKVEFTSLFTFIFSPRKGTKAAEMEDPVSRKEKGRWFKELADVQEIIAAKRTASMKGQTYRVLAEDKGRDEGYIAGRTEGNIIIEFPADETIIGQFCMVKVTEPLTWIVKGELV